MGHVPKPEATTFYPIKSQFELKHVKNQKKNVQLNFQAFNSKFSKLPSQDTSYYTILLTLNYEKINKSIFINIGQRSIFRNRLVIFILLYNVPHRKPHNRCYRDQLGSHNLHNLLKDITMNAFINRHHLVIIVNGWRRTEYRRNVASRSVDDTYPSITAIPGL